VVPEYEPLHVCTGSYSGTNERVHVCNRILFHSCHMHRPSHPTSLEYSNYILIIMVENYKL
jgi:hypothetical protein